MRKVVFVLDHLELGGAERQAIYLVKYFKQHPKFDVYVVGFRNKGKAHELLIKEEIPCDFIPIEISNSKKKIIKNCFKLFLYFWHRKPYAILPYTYWPNLYCGLIWRFTKANFCFWNQRDEGRSIQKNYFEKFALSNASVIVSNSLEGSRFLSSTFNISFNRIKIIYNGVKLDTPICSKEQWYQYMGIDDKTFTVTMIANLHTYKDHITLLKAWRRFVKSKNVNNAVLILAGRPDNNHHYLKALAFDLKLYDSVLFLGPIQDVPGLLNVTDLVAFSSKNEGCPNGILEAMKGNKPVVATDITGAREALGDNYEYFVQPDNEYDLADKIMFFYNNRDLLKAWGERNRDYVDKNFSIEKMQENYINLLEES